MPDTLHPLDPADWDAFRALAHRVLGDMIAYLERVRERPVWQPFPEEARRSLERSGPGADGIGLEAAYDELRRIILPYAIGNVHPRFWGWVRGTGTPGGVLAELITGTLNTSAWGGQQAAPYVEAQVLRWLAGMLGYPVNASGLLTSGCSMSNLVALAVARDAMSGADATEDGVRALRRQPVLYGSTETHSSVEKAVGLLGLGRRSLRRMPVDAEFRVDLHALAAAIARDRAAGFQPIAVIGNAGTVNTGAVDDLEGLAALCRREELWLHVDGAFGALAALVPSLRSLVAGMEQADSLAFDLHKWLHIPYGVGCVLISDAPLHERPFHAAASYLEPLERGAAAGPHDFSRLGPELSRRFRALKVWMALRAHGTAPFAEAIERNVAQARALAERLARATWAEVLAPVALNIVCFRFVLPGRSERELDLLNRRILMALQERGIAVPSATVVRGRFAIRVAITNHRSGEEDFDALVEGVETIGRELGGERPATP